MAVVWIPALLRPLTGGKRQVDVAGATVAEVIEGLEAVYPGIRDRLCQDGRLRSGIALTVNGVLASRGLQEPVDPAAELHFLPAIGGGSSSTRYCP